MKKQKCQTIVKPAATAKFVASLFCSTVLAQGLICLPAPAQKDEAAPPLEVKAFVPERWEAGSFAYGELGSGTKKDLALISAFNPAHAFGEAKDRELVIAIRQKDGKLKKVSSGKNCLQLGMGAAGGDPQVKIERNSVFLEASGGSRQKFTETYQYKQIGPRWALIGYSHKAVDGLSPKMPLVTTDVNLLTGRVEATLLMEQSKPKKDFFYQLFALNSVAPATDISIAPDVHLFRAENVSDGAKIWQGAKDCSALIRAVHTNRQLTVQATVTDNNVTTRDKIWVAGADGKALVASSSHLEKNDLGYTQTVSYTIPSPNSDTDLPGQNRSLRWTVFVDDFDDTRTDTVRLSTKLPSTGYPSRGGVLLMKGRAMPTVETVNAREAEFQAEVIPLPDVM